MHPIRLHAFIDEAGQRSASAKSSDHFVMSAVVIPSDHLGQATALLARLRADLQRPPGTVLHWRNLKAHSDRLHAAKALGGQQWLSVSTVVVCKRHLPVAPGMNDDRSYLYTLRLLLERLSWLARDQSRGMYYTLAHVVRFKLERLREYEAILRAQTTCPIAWSWLDPKGGRLDQPSRCELLQLSDIAASATFQAFEPDRHGNTEPRYLEEFAARLYRRGTAPLTSYGLKMHPWRDTTKAAYPWVAAL
jgi:hypothetical protein